MSLNLSGISHSTVLGRALRFPLKFIPAGLKIPILQGKIRGKLWIVGSANHGHWLGSYEFQERSLFEKTVKKGKVVFDIGAHAGFYTLLASELVGSQGKVFSFEPLPRNLFYLREHLRLNHISNVTVLEKAVSDLCGTAFFDTRQPSSMGHFHQNGNLEIQTVSLDELIARKIILPPDYIKIDVEGAEFLVLTGARETLRAYGPVIFLAVHSQQLCKKCCDLLHSSGYRLEPVGTIDIGTADTIIGYKDSTA